MKNCETRIIFNAYRIQNPGSTRLNQVPGQKSVGERISFRCGRVIVGHVYYIGPLEIQFAARNMPPSKGHTLKRQRPRVSGVA